MKYLSETWHCCEVQVGVVGLKVQILLFQHSGMTARTPLWHQYFAMCLELSVVVLFGYS